MKKSKKATTKKVAAKVSGTTKKFNGKIYKKASCSATVSGAKAAAKKIRDAGGKARVVKATKGACVYSR